MPGSMLTPASSGMETDPPADPSFADLPDAVLACIMQHVPLQQRLSRCALVCRGWEAAAAAVPAHVQVGLYGAAVPTKCSQLQTWLGACGQQVASLKVTHVFDFAYCRESLHLPCHKLCQLQRLELSSVNAYLQHCGVSIGSVGCVDATRLCGASRGSGGSNGGTSSASPHAGSSAAAAAASAVVLPKLKQLRMDCCDVSEQLLAHLGKATGLTQLELRLVSVCSDDLQTRLERQQQVSAVLHLLQDTTGLRNLDFSGHRDDDIAVLQHVSGMRRLQQLSLSLDGSTGTAALATLPVSLTRLELRNGGWSPNLAAAAQLSRLTNLQQVSTARVSVQPDAFHSMTWLPHLRLDVAFGRRWPVSSTQVASMLQALGCLAQLQHLELHHCCLQQLRPSEEEAGYQRFSALTASSQLTALSLSETDYNLLPGPAALDCMFPAGRVLPHLFSLSLRCTDSHGSTPCVGIAQVARIACACPNLHQLELEEVAGQDVGTACLESLPPGVQSVMGLDCRRAE